MAANAMSAPAPASSPVKTDPRIPPGADLPSTTPMSRPNQTPDRAADRSTRPQVSRPMTRSTTRVVFEEPGAVITVRYRGHVPEPELDENGEETGPFGDPQERVRIIKKACPA